MLPSIRRFSLLAVLGVTLLSATAVNAAQSAYLSIGEKTGKFAGALKKKGHEGEFRVLRVVHEVGFEGPPGAAVARTKVHVPVVVTIPLDKTAPALLAAARKGESMGKMVVTGFSKAGKTAEVALYTLEITGAKITRATMVSTTAGNGFDAMELEVSYDTAVVVMHENPLEAIGDANHDVAMDVIKNIKG